MCMHIYIYIQDMCLYVYIQNDILLFDLSETVCVCVCVNGSEGVLAAVGRRAIALFACCSHFLSSLQSLSCAQ